MLIVGLTGSIAMGKSYVATVCRRLRVPTVDADVLVRRLLDGNREVIRRITQRFGSSVVSPAGSIDRGRLGALVFGDPVALGDLERLLHPRVLAAERAFLQEQARVRARVALLEVPLLFETGAQARMDRVIVVSAPACIQAARLRRRVGMTDGRRAAVLARQLPDFAKRRAADYVIHSGLGYAATARQVRRVLRRLRPVRGMAWCPRLWGGLGCA